MHEDEHKGPSLQLRRPTKNNKHSGSSPKWVNNKVFRGTVSSTKESIAQIWHLNRVFRSLNILYKTTPPGGAAGSLFCQR